MSLKFCLVTYESFRTTCMAVKVTIFIVGAQSYLNLVMISTIYDISPPPPDLRKDIKFLLLCMALHDAPCSPNPQEKCVFGSVSRDAQSCA